MKLTKRQLKRIIKEEKAKLLEEGSLSSPEEEQFESALYGLFDAYSKELLVDRPGTDENVALNYAADKILALVNNLLGL